MWYREAVLGARSVPAERIARRSNRQRCYRKGRRPERRHPPSEQVSGVSCPRDGEHLVRRLSWERRLATEPHLPAASHLAVLRLSRELGHSRALPDLPEVRHWVREPGLLAEPRSATAAA